MNTIKNMRLTGIASAITVLGCLTSNFSQAQSNDEFRPAMAYNPSWYIIPSANLFKPDHDFGPNRHGSGAGLRLGKPLSPSWDLQFGPTYSRAHEGDSRFRQNTLGVDLLYMFSRNSLRPFIFIGGGAEFDKANGPTLHTAHTSPYMNVGLGAQYLFTDQWGMQVDVRHAQSYLRGNSDFGFRHAKTNTVTLGVIYAFGKTPMERVPSPTPAPAQAAPPPVVTPTPTPAPEPPPKPRFERYTLSSTELFSFDRSELRLPQPKLDEIADVLNRKPEISSITITGYTDRLGSAKYNNKLSQRRADAVKAYLTDKGVDASRLSTVAKGESDPVVECNEKKRADLIKCLEPNRRVEIEEFTTERRIP